MKRFLAATAIGLGLVGVTHAALAQSIIREPGNHDGSIEVEPHLVVNDLTHYGGFGFGLDLALGVRIGIPILRNGFVRSINNDVRINFGADIYYLAAYTNAAFIWINSPVVLQWNFYLTGRWSVFAEAGVALDIYPVGIDGVNCYDHGGGARSYYCDAFWLYPAGAVGARYHFGGDGHYPTLTLRLGFPTGLNVGVSF